MLYCKHIEEKNPLKQGLKLSFKAKGKKVAQIEEKNPLKQGLKLMVDRYHCL